MTVDLHSTSSNTMTMQSRNLQFRYQSLNKQKEPAKTITRYNK